MSEIFARQIPVTGSFGNQSISQALSIADSGDTILVKSGHYHLDNLNIDKPVFLQGSKGVVLDGDGKNAILHVLSDNVTISGFILQNAGISFIEDNAAIKVHQVKNVIIEGNTLLNNFFSIYLAQSENCKIKNNYIDSHSSSESSSGNGIHLWYCKKIDINDNKIIGQRDGIYFEFVQEGYVENNFCSKNLRYGLHFMFSDNCRYVKNIFRNNGAGVAVMYTKHVQMIGNRFEHNWGPASFGLLLKEINDSVIKNNFFLNNSTGLYSESSNRLEIENNVFDQNGWGVKIMANSMDNYFSENDFLNNSFAVSTNSRQNFNRFEGNYWQDYKGYDLDRNGIGDIPYHPVRLFSLIAEKQHPSLVLLKSFFISLLEVSESIFPVLTPESLIDNSPRMKRIQWYQ